MNIWRIFKIFLSKQNVIEYSQLCQQKKNYLIIGETFAINMDDW